MAIYEGIVREVYKIEKWHPVGTIKYKTKSFLEFQTEKYLEFEGKSLKKRSVVNTWILMLVKVDKI